MLIKKESKGEKRSMKVKQGIITELAQAWQDNVTMNRSPSLHPPVSKGEQL